MTRAAPFALGVVVGAALAATPAPLDVERLVRVIRSHRDPLTGESHCGIACGTAIVAALEEAKS